jgi:mRNA-degrading endonuclease RelE of RelBE toxin-antitoxin system
MSGVRKFVCNNFFPVIEIDIWYAVPYDIVMIFIETSLFTKLIAELLNEDEYANLQQFLLRKPDAGKIIPGSGGVRKLRWSRGSKGKRGGVRIIYYWKKSDSEIWMLTVYEKSKQENIPAKILKKISEEIKNV